MESSTETEESANVRPSVVRKRRLELAISSRCLPGKSASSTPGFNTAAKSAKPGARQAQSTDLLAAFHGKLMKAKPRGCFACGHTCLERLQPMLTSLADWRAELRQLNEQAADRELLWIFQRTRGSAEIVKGRNEV